VVLRKSGAEGEALTRVKSERNSAGYALPGFTPAQETSAFDVAAVQRQGFASPGAAFKHHARAGYPTPMALTDIPCLT
jgi:hypothetical protein